MWGRLAQKIENSGHQDLLLTVTYQARGELQVVAEIPSIKYHFESRGNELLVYGELFEDLVSESIIKVRNARNTMLEL